MYAKRPYAWPMLFLIGACHQTPEPHASQRSSGAITSGQLVLRAEATRDTVTNPEQLILLVTVANTGPVEAVFLDYSLYYSFTVLGPDGDLIPAVEEDMVLASGPDPVRIGPSDSILRIQNLACIGRNARTTSELSEGANCRLRFEPRRAGRYQVVVTYRAPLPPDDAPGEASVRLESDTTQFFFQPRPYVMETIHPVMAREEHSR